MTGIQEEYDIRKQRVQKALKRLSNYGYSPQDISAMPDLQDRISWRTLYRWINGERTPKRRSDVVAIEKLAEKLCT